MARRARPVLFARRRANSVIRNLRASPQTEWPKHLRLARKILVEELSLDDAKALSILEAAFQAAHTCAQAIDKRSSDIAYFDQRHKVRRIFERIANCARRSSANLRRALNDGVGSSFDGQVVDGESIEILFDNLFAAFASAPRSEVSKTVLRATASKSARSSKKLSPAKVRRSLIKSAKFLKQDYLALHPIDQHNVESSLRTLLRSRNAEIDAALISETIAKALKGGKEDGISTSVHDLVTDYVRDVLHIWQQHGLRPVRSRPSTFHRFVDLVLTAAYEPWSKRHDVRLDEILDEVRQFHRSLPEDTRKLIRAAPRRSDIQWLVTDDHVKKAIRPNSKKHP